MGSMSCRHCLLRRSRLRFPLYLARLIALATAITSTIFARAQQVCYGPDGVVAPNDIPCDPQASVSTCCGDGWLCNVDNVCVQADASRTISRGTCTDQSWRSGDCPLFCQGMLAIFNLFSPAKNYVTAPKRRRPAVSPIAFEEKLC